MNETPLHIRQAEGLRALADMIEQNEEMGPLLAYSLRNISTPTGSVDDPKAAMGAFARAAVKHGAKIREDGSDKWFRVVAGWGPIEVEVFGARDKVCERVVVGTETVTRKERDPKAVEAALAEIPEAEVTETVDKIEWRCTPLLASTKDGAAS